MSNGIYQKDRCKAICYLLDGASITLRNKDDIAPHLLYEYLLNAKALVSETQRLLQDALMAVKPSSKPKMYQRQDDGTPAKSTLSGNGWSHWSSTDSDERAAVEKYLKEVEFIRKDRVEFG